MSLSGAQADLENERIAKEQELLAKELYNSQNAISTAVQLCPMYVMLLKRRKEVFQAVNDLLREDRKKVEEMNKRLRTWYGICVAEFQKAIRMDLNKTKVNRITNRLEAGKSIDVIVAETKISVESVLYTICESLFIEEKVNGRRNADMIKILSHPLINITKESFSGFEVFLRCEKRLPPVWIKQLTGNTCNITLIAMCLTYVKVLAGPMRYMDLYEHLDRNQMAPAVLELRLKRSQAFINRHYEQRNGNVNNVKTPEVNYKAMAEKIEKSAKRECAYTEARFETLDKFIQEASTFTTNIPRHAQARIQRSFEQQREQVDEHLHSLDDLILDIDPRMESPTRVYDNDPEVDIIHSTTANLKQSMTVLTLHEAKQLVDPDISVKVFVREKDDPFVSFVQGAHIILKTHKDYKVKLKNEKVISVPSSCLAVDKITDGSLKIGCRVVARYNAKNINKARPRPGWYSGTVVAAMPFKSTCTYTILFDGDFAETVHHSQTRFQVEQSMHVEHGQLDYHEPHHLISKENPVHYIIGAIVKMKPEFPLVKIRRDVDVEVIKRINVKNKQGRDASAYVLEQNGNIVMLRFPKNSSDNCTVIRCSQHDHDDEWIYRGHPRFSALKENQKAVENVKRSELIALGVSVEGCDSSPETSHSNLPTSPFRRRRRRNNAESSAEATAEVTNDNEASRTPRLQVARKSSMLKAAVEKPLGTRKPSSKDIRTIREQYLKCVAADLIFDERTVGEYSARYARYPAHATCSPSCLEGIKEYDTSSVKYHGYSPYMIPLLNGWTRTRYLCTPNKREIGRQATASYNAPCGKHIRNLAGASAFLKQAGSVLTVDLFTFDGFIEIKRYAKPNPQHVKANDFCQDRENISIPVVNSTKPSEPIPMLVYRRTCVPGNLNKSAPELEHLETQTKEFCSGCTCEDDCSDPNRCECQILTREQINRLSETLRPKQRGYDHRLLYERHHSGIYECNDNCKCHRSAEKKKKCYNSVVQQDIKFPLMLFRTPECGWGVRTLVDIPPGAFVSNYAGEIYTDTDGNTFFENRDCYLADLDLVNSAETEKESQGIDYIYNEDGESPSKKRRTFDSKNDTLQFTFTDYFAKGQHMYMIDAFDKGNIGKFYNHSCSPNMAVHNVLVDTHDLRLPWVSFFATRLIRAGEELSWNYGYIPGTIGGRFLYCRCGSTVCEGRLL